MDKSKLLKILRAVFLVIAIAIVLLPAIWTGITGNGFSEIATRVFTSISLVCLIAATLCSANWKNKNSRTGKIATCVGLVYVLIIQWV